MVLRVTLLGLCMGCLQASAVCDLQTAFLVCMHAADESENYVRVSRTDLMHTFANDYLRPDDV